MLAGRFGLEQVIVAPSKLLVTFSMVRFVVAGNILAIVSLLNVHENRVGNRDGGGAFTHLCNGQNSLLLIQCPINIPVPNTGNGGAGFI